MPDIGVVAALPAEAKVWHKSKGDRHVHVVAAGVGATRAAAAAESLLDRGAVALVSWGVAGGLSAGLQTGDLVLPSCIETETGRHNVSSSWRRALAQALHQAQVEVHDGRLWSHARVVTDVRDKQRLAARGLAIVDMEAAAVACVAYAAGVPFVALKCVCDPADRALPAFAARLLHDDGRLRVHVLVSVLLQGPRAWRSLHRMRSDFSAACAGLQRATGAVAATCPA